MRILTISHIIDVQAMREAFCEHSLNVVLSYSNKLAHRSSIRRNKR